MSTLLKDLYSASFYASFAGILEELLPRFDRKDFMSAIFTKGWESKALKERMKHTSLVLHRFFPEDFEKTAGIIAAIANRLKQQHPGLSLEYMFLPDYIETYGITHYKAAIKAMESVTGFTSCEFAVRPFILRYGNKMTRQMYEWSLHDDFRVRRLASEGMRPRLPWAMALPAFKKDPAPILPILENLKNDPAEFVRRSVANNLNDISKDNAATVINIAKQWKGTSNETDAIIKHACRTLLKQGNSEVLKFYNLHSNAKVSVSGFTITTPEVKIGETLAFTFKLQNSGNRQKMIRLEYGVYYLLQKGRLSKKVFKISEKQYHPGETVIITRRQSFKIITTRKYYTGMHKIALIVNGREQGVAFFELS